VEGKQHARQSQSYVVVANHESQYDILLLYGWLDLDLKWVMKQELRKVPGIGIGCEKVGHIFVAQAALGDIVFVELPEIETQVNMRDEVAVVESVKAASDIYAPMSGEIVAINEKLVDAPETINSDPYGEGWFFKLMPDDEAELEELLDADVYKEICDEE
jgi:glycine cleavage system H protein